MVSVDRVLLGIHPIISFFICLIKGSWSMKFKKIGFRVWRQKDVPVCHIFCTSEPIVRIVPIPVPNSVGITIADIGAMASIFLNFQNHSFAPSIVIVSRAGGQLPLQSVGWFPEGNAGQIFVIVRLDVGGRPTNTAAGTEGKKQATLLHSNPKPDGWLCKIA